METVVWLPGVHCTWEGQDSMQLTGSLCICSLAEVPLSQTMLLILGVICSKHLCYKCYVINNIDTFIVHVYVRFYENCLASIASKILQEA